MKCRATLATPTFLALLLITSTASAESYYWHEESANPPKASYVYRYTYNQPCQKLHQYQTSALSTGADTVMHMTVGGNEIAWDNDGGPGLGSQITYFTSCTSGTQQVTIWVRAASNTTGGDPDLGYTFTFKHTQISPAQTIRNEALIPLGGWLLGGAGGVINTSPSETVETVLTNNGATATMLMMLRYDSTSPAHYRLQAWDQSSGVGLGSKLSGTNYGNELWVVATWSRPVQEGPVRVARNDAPLANQDDDSDGIGDNLEAEACTCTASGSYTCAWDSLFSCSLVANKKDSDGDGITDKAELLGIADDDGDAFPQMLPQWGASPRRRDLFVEVDRKTGQAALSQAAAEAIAHVAETPYRNLPLSNLDGSDGISLHLDMGQQCFDDPDDHPTDPDGITELCGDFGGSNEVSNPEGQTCGDVYGSASHISEERHGVFHYVMRNGENGRTSAMPSLCTFMTSTSDARTAGTIMAHELGHQIGLPHYGAANAGRANRKPNYPSIMNYTYDDGIVWDSGGNNWDLDSMQFSDGSLVAHPLAPRSLSESTDYGGSAYIDFLFAPGGFGFSSESGFPRHIDWNRDGEWNSSVRAHVNPEPRETYHGDLEMPGVYGQENLPVLDTATAPGATYLNTYTYVVANESGSLKYTRRTTATWSSVATLASAPAVRTDSSPFVLTSGSNMYVFAVDTGDDLRFARYNASAALVDGWFTVAPPSGVAIHEVSAVLGGSTIYVVATNDTANANYGDVWMGTISGTTWQGWSRVELSGGTPVKSGNIVSGDANATPGIAYGPDARLYMYTLGSGTRAGDVDMYEYGASTWTRTTRTWDPAVNVGIVGRIAAMYRPHADAAGSPLSSGNGAVWAWYNTPWNGGDTHYRWTWGKLTASTQTFNMGMYHRIPIGPGTTCGELDDRENTETDEDETLTGWALVNHPDSLAGFISHTDGPHCGPGVIHVPYADGLAPLPNGLKDFDDVSFIEDNLCLSTNLFTGCTLCVSSGTCSGPITEEIECVKEVDGED